MSQITAHKARIGTISTGTMQTVDLVDAFAGELDYLLTGLDLVNSDTQLVKEAYAWLESGEDTSTTKYDDLHEERGADILESLFEALDEYAPPYCYFGAHEGDGADYGFWPSMDSIDELPKFNDLADVPEGIEDDYAIVNDHGNVSVYSASGEEIVAFV